MGGTGGWRAEKNAVEQVNWVEKHGIKIIYIKVQLNGGFSYL